MAQGFKLRPDVNLAPLTRDHAPNVYRWMCDPTVSQNLGLRSAPSLEKTLAWIERAAQDDSVCPSAILLNGQHVGNVVLDRIDGYLGCARLSVYVGEPSARRAGVGSTGAYLALQDGFERLGLHKVWLTVHPSNYQALNCYTRLGFVLEGILRDEFLLDGRRVPALYMGLLQAEFKLLSPA